MKCRSSVIPNDFFRRTLDGAILAVFALVICTARMGAATVAVPNNSFESPEAPRETPYASPEVGVWQKSDQPFWYASEFPWIQLAGQFFNVPFPGQFIDNCDGAQAAFLFAVPEVALFQDYDSIVDTNGTPNHSFDAVYKPDHNYELTVGVIGGGGGMSNGVTLQLSLYYRDAASNKLNIASTTITNDPAIFATNTHFVDFQVRTPVVKQSDPWAGKHIGIQLLSTTPFQLMSGYWDVDHVRLAEEAGLRLTVAGVTNRQFTFTVTGEPGVPFELLAATNIAAPPGDWISVGTYGNVTGQTVVTDTTTNLHRYYRARQ